MKTTTYLCFMTFFTLSSAYSQIGTSEKKALIDLYNSTGGPEWNIHWELDKPPCFMAWHYFGKWPCGQGQALSEQPEGTAARKSGRTRTSEDARPDL